MTMRALVVDDDEEIVRTVGDILDSLGHEHDAAGDQEGARKLLAPDKYAYVLLDLEIPVRPGRLCRIENGKNLLTEMRQTFGMEDVPVIVMTGHGNDSYELAVSVMKDGAVDYVGKPLNGGKLDKAIREALERRGDGLPAAVKAARKTLEPLKAAKREMVIYEARVAICGIEVWRATYQPDLREILVRLSRKEGGGYVRISGAKLMKELNRDASNPVGRPIKSFCDNASERLAEGRNLACGRYDIIASKGGYHFTDWMDVRVAGEEAAEGPASVPECVRRASAPDGEHALNERQKWILKQLNKGIELRNKDIVQHTKKNRSTINRDLKDLREWGLIATHPDGHYFTIRRASACGGE